MYGTAAGVAARVPRLNATAISTPDMDQLETWLAQGSALIDRILAGAGYAVPVGAGAAAAVELAALAEQYAAAHALRARGIDSLTGEGEARSDVWLREVNETIRELAGSDLTMVGVVLVGSPTSHPRRLRTTQLRRIDGYSATYEGVRSGYTYPSE